MTHQPFNPTNLPFDPDNIAYVVGWTDVKSQESEGYTLVRNIRDLAKGDHGILWRLPEKPWSWLEMDHPTIRQFRDLEGFMEGKPQVYNHWFQDFPKNRHLTAKEQKALYDTLRTEICKYQPEVQAELLLPMFYRR